MDEITEVLSSIALLKELTYRERLAQREKWGEQTHDIFKWLSILGEELGEAHKAAIEGKEEELKIELIQIAAVAWAIRSGIGKDEDTDFCY